MSENNLSGNALNPAELAGYQEGSVVSRTIIKGDTGNVTVFAFDAGQGLSEHTAPFDALVQILEGKAIVTIDGKDQIIEENQWIIMPADIPHALRAEKRFKMALVMIRK